MFSPHAHINVIVIRRGFLGFSRGKCSPHYQGKKSPEPPVWVSSSSWSGRGRSPDVANGRRTYPKHFLVQR